MDRYTMRKQFDVSPFFLFSNSSISFTSSTRLPATPRTTSHRLFSVKAPSVGSQKDTSLLHGGNLLYPLNLFMPTPPARNMPSLNCLVKRVSSDQNSRMSGTSNSTMARRSSPSPNAHARLSSPAMPASPRIFCSITPHPSTSSHSPLKKISSSYDGSVNGKYASTHRISTSPNRCRVSPSSVSLSSLLASSTALTPAASHSLLSNTRTPSIWWNTGKCVASMESRRYTSPVTRNF
mmetsp:Transcript_37116/g.91738  ORF Transcript_37116/g.91738 Transcript_37116/m.91738 type:complete len:236 (-) Transcript_37116:561-1268(-)